METDVREFIVDLNTLKKNGDKDIYDYAENDGINFDSLVTMILEEARKKNIVDVAKVSFELIGEDEERVNVEKTDKKIEDIKREKEEKKEKEIKEEVKEKKPQIVIFPYNKIVAGNETLSLTSFLDCIQILNEEGKSLTIDGVSLDIFSMQYDKVVEILSNISDRRHRPYIIKEEYAVFKEFGVLVSKNSINEKIEKIEVYVDDAINSKFKFEEENKEEKVEEKDESIPKYSVPEFDPSVILEDTKKIDEKEKLLEDKLSEKLLKFSNNNKKDEEEIEIEIEPEIQKEEKVEEKIEETKEEIIDNKENINEKIDKEIEELNTLFEKQKEENRALEDRISKTLEEFKKLKEESINNNKEEKEEIKETNSNVIKREQKEESVENTTKSYVIDSYKGLKEKGNNYLSLYLGQSKDDIRRYFNTTPKEAKDFDDMEMYDNFYAYYDEEDKCTGIGVYNSEEIGKDVAIYLFGKNLVTMSYGDIVKLIKDHDYKAIEDEDGIISLEYGVSIDPKEEANYKNSICDVIHMFKKGYYDEVYNI